MTFRFVFHALVIVMVCGILPSAHGTPITFTSSSSTGSSSSATMINGQLVSGHCTSSKNGVASSCGDPALDVVPDVLTSITPGFATPFMTGLSAFPAMSGFSQLPSSLGSGQPSAIASLGQPASMLNLGQPSMLNFGQSAPILNLAQPLFTPNFGMFPNMFGFQAVNMPGFGFGF